MPAFFCQLRKNMTGLKVTEMAYLLHKIGYKAEESAKALKTVYSDVIPLQMGTTLKTNWITPALNATEMAQILAKLYGTIAAIESYVEDLKAKGKTATETAKDLKQNIPEITSDKLSNYLSKSYHSTDIQAAIKVVFPKPK